MRKAEQKDGCGWAELIIAPVRGDKEWIPYVFVNEVFDYWHSNPF